MGKHVDRAIGKTELKGNNKNNFKIENVKAFKDLTEKVGNLELAIQELADKLVELESKKETTKPEQ